MLFAPVVIGWSNYHCIGFFDVDTHENRSKYNGNDVKLLSIHSNCFRLKINGICFDHHFHSVIC